MENWRGVPLSDIYGSASPWGAPEFPLVSPTYNHAVLYHVGRTSCIPGDKPPSPQRGRDKWDKDCVRMPCSSHNLYPVQEENGSSSLVKRWDIIKSALQKPIRNCEELTEAICSYNTKFRNQWKFRALQQLFNKHLEEEETEYFFNVTLPAIAKLALALPHLIQSPIPLLRQHKNRSMSLTQEQISSLLANAFFCTFPRRNTSKKQAEYSSYPHINFNSLYESAPLPSVIEKLKCICHYFRRVCTKVPVGVLTFTRRTVEPAKCPAWAESTRLIGSVPLHINSSGTIEDDGLGLIQVDFANKYLGGGVLNHGCVQEEIRFVICPELLVSMLFTEVLRPTEALFIIGCERYSSYTGYGSTFQWSGDHEDDTPFDSSGRRRCAVLAIDALPFSNERNQLRREVVNRELNKAWVGVSCYTPPLDVSLLMGVSVGARLLNPRGAFKSLQQLMAWVGVSSYTSPLDESPLMRPGVATGNWGCGAFGGSPTFKSLIQLMACAVARRPVAYYTFGDVTLRNDIIQMYNFLSQHHVTVGQLYKYLIMFSLSNVSIEELYAFIHQLHNDKTKQETMDNTPPQPEDSPSKMNVSTLARRGSPDIFSSGDVSSLSETFLDLERGEACLQANVDVTSFMKEQTKQEFLQDHPACVQEQLTSKRGDTTKSVGDTKPLEDTLKSVEDTSKPELKCSPGTHQTTSLFEDMTKFDEANSKMDFHKSKVSSLFANEDFVMGDDTAMSSSPTEDLSLTDMAPGVSTPSDKCESEKSGAKKMARKITDYFNKKF